MNPTTNSPRDRGRASFDRHDWGEAFDAFASAERDAPLDRDDLERLVWSAALRGHDEAFLGALERLHKACVEAQEGRRAARAAFWIGFHLSSLGSASAAGWLARASRLVENEQEPCVERGYVLLPAVYRHLGAADDVAAQAVASEAARIGERCGDRDLVALARNLEGRALLRQARVEAGLALLDEVMVAVTSGELSPLVTGIVYCNVIACCQQVYALDRAREWTAALARWCNEQPQLVTFTGICLVHRAEIMQLGGAWPEAIEAVRQVCDRCTDADPEVFGDACYQRGELLRLRGELDEADQAYRLASEHGREPQPGLALLRLAQGQTESAATAIRRVLATTSVKWQRARLLPAFVEIMLSAGELDDARAACRELEDIAREFGTEIIGAMAAHARGAVSIAEGDHHGAIEPLRHAFGVWHRVGAPYLAARIRVLIGRSFLGLGDGEGAKLERDAARKVFAALGAARDLAVVDAADGSASTAKPVPAHELSKRELEVLRLVASGKTNKAIARELFVSERTVDRHVSNIFTKIGVGTRAAATAFAYENGLV
ncbi:MAG TPA: LuxR C-terminal-related transcriptional regulator [Burkholderiales bacterium]|nr:LuxR C-terminal-related transcriptional regulator [Burkholderiales bacterium]